MLRFHLPLIEPDERISRIRLSDEVSGSCPRKALHDHLRGEQSKRAVQIIIWIPATPDSSLVLHAEPPAANPKWPRWTLFAGALLAASMPSISAMVRARWTELFRDRPELSTAFAFESAADELVYIIGVTLSVALSVTLFPEAGVLASTLLLMLGTAAFVLQRKTEPARRRSKHASKSSAILLRPVQLITITMVFVGAIFATAEVTTVALTRQLGNPDAASLVIAGYAAGSFVVGVLIGGVKLRAQLQRQLLVALKRVTGHDIAAASRGFGAIAGRDDFSQRHRSSCSKSAGARDAPR
jgi:hypothetical protein